MRPRLAVFDMIGTTVEAGEEVPHAFVEAFRRIGVSLPDDAVTGVRGRSKEEAIADLVGAYLPGVENAAGVSAQVYSSFRSILRDSYEEGARWVPGVRTALQRLQTRGMLVVLTTGLDRDTTTHLLRGLAYDRMGLRGVVTGDDVERGRPAPDLIHAAMTLTGEGDPGCVLAVGDTVSDLEAATRAQVGWSVGVLTGAHSREQLQAHPHSAILDSVARIPDWLDQVGAWS